MKAKKAIQSKMARENSYDDDKRRLEELFNEYDVLTGSIANGSGESDLQ